jgi:hypothetical protein
MMKHLCLILVAALAACSTPRSPEVGQGIAPAFSASRAVPATATNAEPLPAGVVFTTYVHSFSSAASAQPSKAHSPRTSKSGLTKRSRAVTREFQRLNPCPTTGKRSGACPGMIKDHREPLACGGRDAVDNMQWETIQEAKEKDKWELRCKTERRVK